MKNNFRLLDRFHFRSSTDQTTREPAHKDFRHEWRKISSHYSMALCFVLLLAVGMVKAQEQKIAFDVKFDHESQVYHCGEMAKVTYQITNGQKPLTEGSLFVRFTNDNGALISEKQEPLTGKPITVSETMKVPGFLSVRAFVLDTKGKRITNTLSGAAFDPEKIEPGQAKPDDFDEYIAACKKEVRAIPLDMQSKKLDSLCNEKRDVFEISFATVNNQRVYGFLSVPKTGQKPYPAMINVPGAGPGRGPDLHYVDRGFIVLAMNVFPYPVPTDSKQRQQVYNDYNASLKKTYCYYGANDRNTYFFRAAYLGIDRAIDWFADRDDVDKNRIGYEGTSQGGASALILAGLNKNIKYAVSSVPALCDHSGLLQGRAAGWPQIGNFYNRDPKVLDAVRYWDAVNFARYIQCPIKVTVGFIDVTCSPSSVYAAYNVIPSANKEILHERRMGHANGEQFTKAIAWLLEQYK